MNSKLKNLFLAKLNYELSPNFDQSFFNKLSLEQGKNLLFHKWYAFFVSSTATLCVFFFAITSHNFTPDSALSKRQIIDSFITMQSALDSFDLDDVNNLTAYHADEIDME